MLGPTSAAILTGPEGSGCNLPDGGWNALNDVNGLTLMTVTREDSRDGGLDKQGSGKILQRLPVVRVKEGAYVSS